MLARRAFAQAGFKIPCSVVEIKVCQIQTSFYCQITKPESCFLSEELGRKVGADVLVATDPDADRVGVEVPPKRW